MTCAVVDCSQPGRLVEVRLNTYADATKRTRARVAVLVPLCAGHQYVHGWAWSSVPLPFDGTFPDDYAEFHGRRVGRL